jgi:hypothetical protein
MKYILLVILIICSAESADTLHTFSAGDTARAAQMNENFSFLLSLIQANKAETDGVLGNLRDSILQLQDSASAAHALALALRDSLAQVRSSLQDSISRVKALTLLPVGTIVASLLPPMKFYELLGEAEDCWKIADGQDASGLTEYADNVGSGKVIDLRGMFLRGLNYDENGVARADGKEDPDGAGRASGDYQADEFKRHSHIEDLATGDNANIFNGGTYGLVKAGRTGEEGGTETRPKNVAVYWYIKVK